MIVYAYEMLLITNELEREFPNPCHYYVQISGSVIIGRAVCLEAVGKSFANNNKKLKVLIAQTILMIKMIIIIVQAVQTMERM